jgi:hypothetical protein
MVEWLIKQVRLASLKFTAMPSIKAGKHGPGQASNVDATEWLTFDKDPAITLLLDTATSAWSYPPK